MVFPAERSRVVHAYTVPTLISQLPLVRTYVFGMAVMGVGAWLYRVLFHLRVHPRLAYVVTHVKRLGGSMLEFELKPEAAALNFLPGQFAFFGVPAHGRREAHPFTISITEAINTSDLAVYICGPSAMRDALAEPFVEAGIPNRNIHSEEFSFR